MTTILNFKFRKFIFIHILLFIISSILGFLAGNLTRDVKSIEFFNKPFLEYFWHNLLICIVIILIGIISNGYLLWIFMIMNGYVLGSAIGMLSSNFTSLDIILLFMHGLFELPALFVSVYIGKCLGTIIINKIFSRPQLFRKSFIKIIFFLVVLMVILLLIASIIESLPKLGG